jgi:hypothetical protein
MNHAEQMLKVITGNVIEKYIEDFGMDNAFDINLVDEDDLIEVAMYLCNQNEDFADILAADQYFEIPKAIFNCLLRKKEGSQLIEMKNQIKNVVLEGYKKQLISLLDVAYTVHRMDYIQMNNLKECTDPETGETYIRKIGASYIESDNI